LKLQLTYQLYLISLPSKLFKELAAKVRKKKGVEKLRDLTFSSSTTSISLVIKTNDLRFDCYKNSKDPMIATSIIQVNREVKDSKAKKFIKGSSKDYLGTYQVITKIPFHLGQNFNAQALASEIEGTGGASSSLSGGGSGTTATMTDAYGRDYYIDANGNSQWVHETTAGYTGGTTATAGATAAASE
jgi:hypothetical protein